MEVLSSPTTTVKAAAAEVAQDDSKEICDQPSTSGHRLNDSPPQVEKMQIDSTESSCGESQKSINPVEKKKIKMNDDPPTFSSGQLNLVNETK